MTSHSSQYDLIIVGAGMVGATLACLLAQQGKKIAVVESYFPDEFLTGAPADLRVSAINPASQETFVEIGAWQHMLAMRVSPYEAMQVWDSTGEGKISFSAAELGEPALGHIIENKVVQLALLTVMQAEENIDLIYPASMVSYEIIAEKVHLTTADGSKLVAELLIGADGANSKVRVLSGIALQSNDYAQQGLVATVQTEQAHQCTAWQRFLPSGPLALLPLSDGTCSIVWTLAADKADYYVKMEEQAFNRALGEAFGFRLGNISVLGKRAVFPLIGRHAEQYVLSHVALVGDAAHTIHPLAGQGVNLGIKDAVKLASVIRASSRAIGSYQLLRRYERARKGENLLTQKVMEGFKVLFGHPFSAVKSSRNFGLNAVDRLGFVKNEIMRKAMGID